MPRSMNSARAASMSVTTRCSPCGEPGAADVIPLPMMIEHSEPGGVNRTTRKSSSRRDRYPDGRSIHKGGIGTLLTVIRRGFPGRPSRLFRCAHQRVSGLKCNSSCRLVQCSQESSKDRRRAVAVRGYDGTESVFEKIGVLTLTCRLSDQQWWGES